MPEEKVKKYFREFLLGLDYCIIIISNHCVLVHNFAHIVHRDIKPDNLLIDNTDTVKIGDFGIS